MTLLMLKIGGSLATHKQSEIPSLNKEVLERIGSEIKNSVDFNKDNLVLIHGAGNYGHPIVKITGIYNGVNNHDDLIAFARTQVSVNLLNADICNIFQKHRIPAFPVQASALACMKAKVLDKMDLSVIKEQIKINLVPVLYGVPAFDSIQGCSILSGDEIIYKLAENFNPERLILATDVDGVLDEDGKVIKTLDFDKFIKMRDKIRGSSHTDVTGGMLGKVEQLFKLRGKNIKPQIINGMIPGNIKEALKGNKNIGTFIVL